MNIEGERQSFNVRKGKYGSKLQRTQHFGKSIVGSIYNEFVGYKFGASKIFVFHPALEHEGQ